jgi:signal transduction histidine kinase
MKRTGWYRAALVGAIFIVLLNTWLASRALHTLLTSQFWQAHTLEVISSTEQLVANVRTAESAARGYILTSSPVFEQQFAEASSILGASIERLQTLTVDNASQQRRIANLHVRVNAKMSVLDAGMAVRRGHPTGMLDPALLGAVVNDTPDRVESVHVAIRDIEAEENRLLAQRASATDSARRQVWVSFTIAFILDFVLLVAAYQLLIRTNRDRERIAEGAASIAALNHSLTAVNTQLEARVELRTRELAVSNRELEAFSYSVSHDLRAPLRTIDGFSLALLEDFADKLNDEGRDYIARVRNGVQRMGSLIDALLQLSRVTRSDVQAERVDLSQLANLVFQELQAADPQRDVHFLAQPGVLVQGDPRLLRIALENLIGNAWKFTSKTPDARIEFGSRPGTGTSAGLPVYFIRDNGAGFDMHYVDRLFTAFQRLHGDRDFKGSGIGLATVSRIVRRHHGAIAAEGEPGRGATFFFTLQAEVLNSPQPVTP